jgi:hypothetical protein
MCQTAGDGVGVDEELRALIRRSGAGRVPLGVVAPKGWVRAPDKPIATYCSRPCRVAHIAKTEV